MADNITVDNGGLTDYVASTKELTGAKHVIGVELVTAVSAGARTDLAKAEDAAHSTGDYGIMALAVRKDSAAALAGTDGDYIPLIVDNTGALHVTADFLAGGLTDTELRATPVDVAVNASSISTDHSSVGQLVNRAAHWDGNTANAPTALEIKYFSETVTASDTDEELIAAVTSKRLTILSLVVQCGGTATDVTFESSTTTRIHKVPAGANGGQVLPSGTAPWFRTAAGESLTVTTGTGSSVEISGSYVEAPA